MTNTTDPTPRPTQNAMTALVCSSHDGMKYFWIADWNKDIGESGAWVTRDSMIFANELAAAKPPSVAGTSAEDAVRALVRPIERDEDYDRTYIPLPGGWEVQTKGRGSPFRIVGPDKFRLLIEDRPYLHETLERMARDIHDAFTAAQSRAQGGVDSGGVG